MKARERIDTWAGSILCGPRAYKLFRLAAVWTTILLAFIVITVAVYDRTAPNGLARLSIQVMGGCLGTIGAFAALIIFLGMLAYLFRWDHSSSKVLWLSVFLLTAWFGSSLYFFVVYRKQVMVTEIVP